ncbi:MAG: HAD-IA family hydrolase [Bacilli bacterium]|nr:HAD-IA family hydrolase [Bacilli bacterium]
MIKYIILDVDRTLVDSYKPELLSFQEAMKNVIGYNMTESQSRDFTTMPTKAFLKSLNISEENSNKIMKEWESTFSKYKVKCFDGIKDVIRTLHENGHIIGLITSRTLDEYHELDDELGDISELFKIIVTSDKIIKPKPDKQSMEYLCNELNCSGSEVVYIGDSYVDKEFALNSNCAFIPACYDNRELINEENACFNPKDIPSIIDTLTQKNQTGKTR